MTRMPWQSHFPEGDLWVFGYGSLIWKPPPHYDQRIPGYIEGYVRRFWQASTDHRGTKDSPGRVVTVIERKFWETLSDKKDGSSSNPSSPRVYGAAYHIPRTHAREVRAYLDEREIDGYTVHYTTFHPARQQQQQQHECEIDEISPPMTCMVYIGLPTNPQFLSSPALRHPDAITQVIGKASGLSGSNREYLFLLEKALEDIGLGLADEHVTGLVQRVKALEGIRDGEREAPEEAEAAATVRSNVMSSRQR